MQARSRTILALAIAILALSSSAILVRVTRTPPLITAFYRQLFCAVMIFPFVGGAPASQLSPRERKLLVVSGFFLAVHFATWISSLFLTTVARATLLVDLQPVWATLLAFVFLKERLSLREALSVMVVTTGGLLIAVSGFGGENSMLAGDLLAIAGGIAGAAYLLIGRKVRLAIPWVRYMFAVYAISAFFLFLFCVALSLRFPFPAERDIPWILLMAIGPGILGHGLLNVAIRDMKAYAVNAALLAEPVIATMLAFLIFAEKPDGYYYIGATLIFAGLFYIIRKKPELEDISEL